jgi:hypothetical protein
LSNTYSYQKQTIFSSFSRRKKYQLDEDEDEEDEDDSLEEEGQPHQKINKYTRQVQRKSEDGDEVTKDHPSRRT